MRSYVLGAEAAQDVVDIWDYIAGDNVDAADQLIEKFFEAFDLIAARPQIGHKRKDLTRLPLLFWPIGSYLVIYRIGRKTIEIVAVAHGSRDVPILLRTRS